MAFFRHPPNPDDRGDVMLLDGSGQARTISTGWESLEGLAWSASGKEVWFSAAQSGEQYCIHAASLAGKERTVYCGTAPTRILDIATSGRALVSTEETRGSMALVEHGSDPSQERDLSWLSYSWGPQISDDGTEILFTDLSEQAGNDYSVYVRKSDGSPAVRLAGGGFGTSISPDGKWALVLLADDPQARIQVVPVGAGQAHMPHWDGIQPRWADWFPDGQHILMTASQSGQPEAVYITDVNGATPKQLSTGNVSWRAGAPGAKSFVVSENGAWVVRSISDGTIQPVHGIQPGEYPVGWALDGKHLFVQISSPTGLTIYKLDVESGKRELWRTVTPKDQVGLRPMNVPISITPDGRWLAFTYRTQLGQLYRSDTLK